MHSTSYEADVSGTLVLQLNTHHHALVDIAVIQNRLDHIVAIRIAKELLQTRAIQDLGDEGFADLGVSDTNALLHDV